MPLLFRKRKRKPPVPVARRGTPQQRKIPTMSVQGRRYFHDPEAAYLLPKDLADVPRLDFQHFLLRQAMKGNYVSPLPDTLETILDVGCGTGRWGIEMAQAFPNAQVVGIDLEELCSTGVERPANYLFTQANVLHPLPFADHAFDCVHQRLMLMSIPAFKWPVVLRELVRVTKPGGWIELVEVGCTIFPRGPATHRWYEWIRASSQIYDQDPDLPISLARLAAEAGMRTISELHYDLPIGEWAGHLGATSLANMQSFYHALGPRYAAQLHIDAQTIETTWVQLVNEWRQRRSHIRYFVVCGQKERQDS